MKKKWSGLCVSKNFTNLYKPFIILYFPNTKINNIFKTLCLSHYFSGLCELNTLKAHPSPQIDIHSVKFRKTTLACQYTDIEYIVL